ncbi:rRNA adenine N-6-methyltransferase family protein [Nonomuraea roseoviolacea]|uniref:Protein-L-isoaspartate O-methyltransferase n=1 Tax=Nonomuraea roseoviolacea subsp. carminata TaxID=160689 RepID=A0ABT1KCH4_9ACTN|nr:rRNA adenine N-6-methyltransferase family protein [Nonomuraea roseoviolacea]MCP2351713.1 protein-L-isoaspartate O-methyltransferase [Nonomuraea roseoviolacea subsp. carminata]
MGPVSRSDLGEEGRLHLAYADKTLVTQIDGLGAASATTPQTDWLTSSATLLTLVVRMLELADIDPGDRVLEIGTGTGTGYFTALLLCHRLGDKNVTSIEYDPDVAAQAAAHLDAAGYAPRLVVGDGLQGHSEGAEYSTVIAPCAARTIPPSCLWQLSDAGMIITTLSGWLLASGLVRLASCVLS